MGLIRIPFFGQSLLLKSNKKNHDALVKGVNNKTIPHAQLFYGPSKTKKFLF